MFNVFLNQLTMKYKLQCIYCFRLKITDFKYIFKEIFFLLYKYFLFILICKILKKDKSLRIIFL